MITNVLADGDPKVVSHDDVAPVTIPSQYLLGDIGHSLPELAELLRDQSVQAEHLEEKKKLLQSLQVLKLKG